MTAADERYQVLGKLFAEVLERGMDLVGGARGLAASRIPVVVTGAGLGLPGGSRVFADENVRRILRGDQFIETVPLKIRHAIADKHVTRLVKSDHGGGPRFETIDSAADVIKLAGRSGALDLAEEFGVPAERVPALDVTTRLAFGAGIEALRDAGIPLVMRYKTTTRGTKLPDRWLLPEALQATTGVIFGSAFPGYDAFATDMDRLHADLARRERVADLEALRTRLVGHADAQVLAEIDRRIEELRAGLNDGVYSLDRRFLFRVLAMGHSQFAEYIGARGPNTQLNGACASGVQAMSLAEDWIREGRCKRVIVVTADDVTTDHLMQWIGAGFLASGAAATDELVEDAALPFDRRRHGMILGMGATAMVVESAEAAEQRGVAPVCEVLGTVVANSAFHGSRLDVEHISTVMESLVASVETRTGVDRAALARELVFVSHETYTPARGGSAQAEIVALRRVFGADADKVVIANTKGFTGHAMGAGVEDVVALRMLETSLVPPVANYKEVDPELGALNLSRGGAYPVRYALRLAAGFGSQICMMLLRWVPTPTGEHVSPEQLGYAYRVTDRARFEQWLAACSGDHAPELEVVKRTLRVKDRGVATTVAREPANELVAPSPVPEVRAVAPPPLSAPAPRPAEATPPAPTTREPVAAAPRVEDPIRAKVLEIVSAQTGYPVEMLDVDLDLEADLGVDTVKQAETFAAVREAYGIAREANLKLREFPTLTHVIRWVKEKRPDLTSAPMAPAAKAPTPGVAPPGNGPPAPAEPSAAPSEDPVRAKVIEIVAGQTGYPAEMLDVDLDLEADLGVDTVKQAETFAAVREAYGIPREANLKLRDFPTLTHVIRWVKEHRPDLADGGARVAAPTAERAATVARSDGASANPAPALAVGDPEAAARVPRRVPVAVLRPELDVCKATGIDLSRGARVLVVSDAGGVGDALARVLEARGVEVLVVRGAPSADETSARVDVFRRAGGITGLYWLPALDDAGELAAMDAAAFREALRVRVKALFQVTRAIYTELEAGTFVVTATRLGGKHGYDDRAEGPDAGSLALGGAVTGFAKTLARERASALVKAVDLEVDVAPEAAAEILVAETLGDPGAVEIGHAGGLRWTVALRDEPLSTGDDRAVASALRPDSVVVVTGAAGSIVSAIVADLARRAQGGTFYLLDLAPGPNLDDPDLALFARDRDAMKAELVERAKARGERATPAQIERQLAALEREAAAAGAQRAIAQAGGVAEYCSLDLRDGAAVASVVDEIRARHGRIDVLLHAAGLEVSHFVPGKSAEEFDRVFDVKVEGWFSIWRALGDMPLGVWVAFSSIAGRFGNAGQTDYAAANDLLCKLAARTSRLRPGARGLAIDWTAWAGIGMASRGSIPKMMELAGIDMLPAAAGIPIIGRELAARSSGEVVVAERLGVLLADRDETGGVDVEALARRPHGPMVGAVRGMRPSEGLLVETALDPNEQPFLRDHAIEGTPVLPGVMSIEAFTEASLLLLPDWHVRAVEDVAFLAPFKFYRGEPRTLRVLAQAIAEGADVVVDCRLLGERELPNAASPQVTLHASARVRLSPRTAPAPGSRPPARDGQHKVERGDIYRVFFHGPAYQVLAEAFRSDGSVLGRMTDALPSNHAPDDRVTVLDPRLLELCFQTAGVFEIGTTGRMGLPNHVDRVESFAAPAAGAPVWAEVTPRSDGTYDARVVDEIGHVLATLEGYRTITLGDVDDEHRRPLAGAMSLA